MSPARPPLPPEQLREAVRDMIGILRAMCLANHGEPHRLAAIVEAGQRLRELDEAIASGGDLEGAERAADAAVNAVLGSLHFNASLAPVLSHAAGRVLASRRR